MCWQGRKSHRNHTWIYLVRLLLVGSEGRASPWEDGHGRWAGVPQSRKAQAVLFLFEKGVLEAC